LGLDFETPLRLSHFQGLFEIGIRYEKSPQLTFEGISADSCGFSGIPEEFHDFAERAGLPPPARAVLGDPKGGRQFRTDIRSLRSLSLFFLRFYRSKLRTSSELRASLFLVRNLRCARLPSEKTMPRQLAGHRFEIAERAGLPPRSALR